MVEPLQEFLQKQETMESEAVSRPQCNLCLLVV